MPSSSFLKNLASFIFKLYIFLLIYFEYNLLTAQNTALIVALVILELCPTPYVVSPVLSSLIQTYAAAFALEPSSSECSE